MKRFVWNVITAGRGMDADIEILRRLLILNALLIPGVFFSFTLGIIAFAEGNPLLGVVDSFVFLIQLFLIFLCRKTSNFDIPVYIAVTTLMIFSAFLAVNGGVENSAILWVLLFPPVAVSLLRARQGIVFSILLLLLIFAVFALQNNNFIRGEYSSAFQVRLTAVYITITLLSIIGEELRSRIQSRLRRSNREKEEAILELNISLSEIKTLQGILPICSHCHKIRNDEGYWEAVEHYIHSKTDAQFSHALCPDCLDKYYPDYKHQDNAE